MLTNALKENPQTAFLITIVNEGGPSVCQVLFIDSVTDKGFLLDVPPNTGSIIESLNRVDGIGVLYKAGKPEQLKHKIAEMVNHPIPFYLDFSIADLGNLVDLCGGIELFIANAIESVSGDQITLLPAGNVLLDGSKVQDFVRYEDPGERELERIDRNHKLIQALLRSISDNSAYLLEPSVFKFFQDFCSSNLDGKALQKFIEETSDLDIERIGKRRVLGNVRTVDGKDLLFPHFEGELLVQTVTQNLEALESTEIRDTQDLTIAVNILNGTTVTGLARRTKDLLENFGFEVVSFSNADSNDIEKTAVIDRTGDISNAQRVGEVIRCNNVYTEMDDISAESMEFHPDVTVLLGKDFDGRYVKE
jgi:anionic cell wall polymer biosynthesis LytR-Cps2A-Psr (LCP) family protein